MRGGDRFLLNFLSVHIYPKVYGSISYSEEEIVLVFPKPDTQNTIRSPIIHHRVFSIIFISPNSLLYKLTY